MGATEFVEKIKKREAVVGVCGLGYVGLPLVRTFNRVGFKIIGFDIDQKKVDALNAGESYIKHIDFDELKKSINADKFLPTVDFSKIKDADAILIAVPTPLTKTREPDLTAVRKTCEAIAVHLRKDHIVILESTTYPGTTKEVCIPILEEKSGMKAGEDFFVAYSPEREDPGNPNFETSTIPKVVGGLDEDSKKVAVALYSAIIDRVVAVSSLGASELSKIFENTFRAVNIALVNELKLMCMRMDIDVWEVIDAAATKPFGFMKFYPGPGLGGHCIPIDPFYLTWKAREHDFATRFIELAGEINTQMPYHIVDNLMHLLNDRQISLNGSHILVLGIAYKENIDDLRESPSLKIIDMLRSKGAKVLYNDPHCPIMKKTRHFDLGMQSVELTPELLDSQDAVIVLTAHKAYDWEFVNKYANLIVDTRNALKTIKDRTKIRKI